MTPQSSTRIQTENYRDTFAEQLRGTKVDEHLLLTMCRSSVRSLHKPQYLSTLLMFIQSGSKYVSIHRLSVTQQGGSSVMSLKAFKASKAFNSTSANLSRPVLSSPVSGIWPGPFLLHLHICSPAPRRVKVICGNHTWCLVLGDQTLSLSMFCASHPHQWSLTKGSRVLGHGPHCSVCFARTMAAAGRWSVGYLPSRAYLHETHLVAASCWMDLKEDAQTKQ
jgi:hypothetical protein